MELRKNLSKVFNIIFPFTDFLYLLQQEEYSLQRFWFWFPRFFFRRNIQKRDKIVYTQRAKNTLTLSILLFVFANYFVCNVVFLLLSCMAIPFFVLVSNLFFDQVYGLIKKNIIRKAFTYFEENRGSVKVVAVTGSYGKTTVKNFVEQLVKYSYKTQMIPGNINSTIGVASWILNNFKKGTEVLIVEMDSYKPNRIKETTLLVKPDIAILTNIGDQHLQRYKTKEALAHTLFELFQFSSKDNLKITNKETLQYLEKIGMDSSGLTIVGNAQNDSISASNNSNLAYALSVANDLSIPQQYIDSVSKSLTPPDRRQSSKNIAGFSGIDDSYNISFTTAVSGITEAKRQAKLSNKKLLVITAGIPELGPEEQDKNKKLGEFLNKTADQVFVLESIFYKEVVSGFYDTTKVKTFQNFIVAMDKLTRDYDPLEWFVLLEPELTDLYY